MCSTDLIDWVYKSLNQKGGGPTPRRSEQREKSLYINTFIKCGWDPVYVRRTFRNLTDLMTEDWHPELFVEEYAKAVIRNLPDTDDIRGSLRVVGLREPIIDYCEQIIKPLINSYYYTSSQLLDLAIEKLTGSSFVPLTVSGEWPLNPHIAMTWYPIADNTSVKGFNVTRDLYNLISAPILMGHIRTLTNRNRSPNKLFYHSTNWSGGLSIIKQLSRLRGRPCLDFGIRQGFYMSESLDIALDWVVKHRYAGDNQAAIVIFSLPQPLPRHLKVCSLVGNDWLNITKSTRRCKVHDNELPELLDCHFVYGNMVANPSAVKKGDDPVTHTPPKKQLASKSDVADQFLHQHIIGCLFFSNR